MFNQKFDNECCKTVGDVELPVENTALNFTTGAANTLTGACCH